MPPLQHSETDFQGWVAGGDHRRAAEWLVLRYADEVMGLCTAMVRDRSAAEDLVQDVFGRAFTGLGGFRGEASSRTWLLKIARNRCIDHLRARKREPWGVVDPDAELEPDALPDEDPLPSDLLGRRDAVEAALEQLVEGDRALIVLRFRNGLDYKELAVAFGLKEGTVRMRVSRSLKRMRTALELRELAAPLAFDSAEVAKVAELAEEDSFADVARARAERAPGAPPSQAAAPPRMPSIAQGPPAARRMAVPKKAKARKRSVLSAALGAIFGEAPAAPAPPVEHPLTAFFAATRDALSDNLRDSLLESARVI